MGSELCVTGLGITTAVGQGKQATLRSLQAGSHAFATMQREGRQRASAFLGAEIADLALPKSLGHKTLRTASWSARVALVTLHESWMDAQLQTVDAERIGLVVGGSNLQQREHCVMRESLAGRERFILPSYGLAYLDSDLCGLCTETYGIRGPSFTVGGASASGQLAIIHALESVAAGRVDVCVAIGALADLSYWECHALRSLGAMGSDRYADRPQLACRPFDSSRDGFIFGEACGAVVVETAAHASARGVMPYARARGWSVVMDAHRNPDPSLTGETQAIVRALKNSALSAEQIDYVNPHGSGSVIGDEVELQALRNCGLTHARINATKSVFGHGLSAAGAVEVVATLLQMHSGSLHPTRNLEREIDASFSWVKERCEPHHMQNALSLSIGFGGINTALCLSRFDQAARIFL